MATADNFMVSDFPDVDPHQFGPDSDAVTLTDPTHDIDGDGTLDTLTFHAEDSLVVATDLDGDHLADTITTVHDDGEYEAWEFHRGEDGEPRWEQADAGTLGQG